MEYKDYYKILDVSRDATRETIKQAYRKIARKYHPDVSKEPDAEEKFKEAGEAYEVLKDPEKRKAYDNFGQDWQNGQDFKPPPNWNSGFDFSGAGYTGGDATGFSDFFEALFGRHQYTGPHSHTPFFKMKGEDQHAKVTINLSDAYHGAKQTLTLSRSTIDERGRVSKRPHTLNIVIPKGIVEGQRIRLEGQGLPGTGGSPSGDLYLEIMFRKERLFKVDKRDIHLTLPVTPWEAALGATLTVPTLGGKVQLKIPSGSQGGKKLRLKGRGLSTATKQGDQYITLRIVVPAPTTDQQKNLYKTMADILPANPRAELGL